MRFAPVLAIALLPGCAFLPPASSRMMDRCQPLMTGPFATFNDCLQRADLVRGYQDSSQTNLKAAATIAARRVAAGQWSEERAYTALIDAAAVLSAIRQEEADANIGVAAGLIGTGAAIASPPPVISADPPPMRFR